MVKDKIFKTEYIIGIIIPVVIVGLIIFATNRGDDTYELSNKKDISYKNDTKENHEILPITSPVKNEITDKDISNQVIGKWIQNQNYRITIFKKDGKYYLGEENGQGVRKDYELIKKNLQGNQAFIIKEIFEGTNVPNDVQLINEYTDYYIIDQDGDLALYDKDGLIEKYNKTN